MAKKSYKSGGVVVGNNITNLNDGTKGGIFKGARHSEGGIPVKVIGGGNAEVETDEALLVPEAVNNPTPVQFEGQKMTPKQVLSRINQRHGGVPIKKRGGILENGGNVDDLDTPIKVKPTSVVITRGAVLDNEKYEFEGEMLTNKEIMSRINQMGGGASFEKGGKLPKSITTTGKKYKYKGKNVEDFEIVKSCGYKHKMADGGGIDVIEELDYFVVRLDTDDWSDTAYMGYDEGEADSYFEDADLDNLPDNSKRRGGSVTKEKYKVSFKYVNQDEPVEDYPVEDYYDDSDYWEEVENGYQNSIIEEFEEREIIGTDSLENEEKEQAERVLEQVVSMLEQNPNVIHYEKAGFYIRPSYYFIYKISDSENIEIRVSNHSLNPSNIESNPSIILDKNYVRRENIEDHVKDWDEDSFGISATDFNDDLVEIIHKKPKNRIAFFSAVIFAVENETEDDFDDSEVSDAVVYEEEEYNLSELNMSADDIYEEIISRVTELAENNEGGVIFQDGGQFEKDAINDATVTFKNFHIDTFANFTKISKKEIPNRKPDFESKSGSKYWYDQDEVIRQSDHWGRTIATCNWLIDSKAQKGLTQGKCKLKDFHRQFIQLLDDEKNIGKTFKVVKTVLVRNGGGKIDIDEMKGVFKKASSDYYIFDNFKVGYQTLAYVEPTQKFHDGGSLDESVYRTLAYLESGKTRMYKGKLSFKDLYEYGILAEKIHHIEIVKKANSSQFGDFYTWSEKVVFERYNCMFDEGFPIIKYDKINDGSLEIIEAIGILTDSSIVVFDGYRGVWEKQFGGGGTIPDDEDDKIHREWKRLINMSKSELEAFYNSEEGKRAGLSTSEAKELGIHSGRESARNIIRMKSKPYSKWDAKDFEWASWQISFIKRMSGNKGDLYDDKGNKTRKHLSLLIWGHNPEKKSFYIGGKLIKRADGHYSRHGLWDSIRENKGSGKKPTQQMLLQEAKLKKRNTVGKLS